MNWLAILWSCSASACLMLALVNLFVWLKDRRRIEHALFAVMAVGVAGIAACELQIMFSQSPEQFGRWVRWIHVPIFLAVVSTVWFLWFELRSGRAWLAWAVCAMRLLALVLNFTIGPNLTFNEITSLRHEHVLGQAVSVAQGVVSNRTRVGELASLLLLAFAVDASLSLWRRGNRQDRGRAVLVGGSVVLFVLFAAGHVSLIHAGVIHMPYMISVAFLIPLLAMAYQLGADVFRAGELSRDLDISRAELRENERRMEHAAAAAEFGLWRWDIARNHLWISEKGRDLLGLNGNGKMDPEHFLDAL